MNAPSTAQILVDRALDATCSQSCVDWALRLMEEGEDSPSLRVLAGASHPYNHFELASWRDAALSELGIVPLPLDLAIRKLALEVLQSGLSGGDKEMVQAVTALKDLCIAAKYQREIYEFYLLYFANDDLGDMEWSPHLPGAKRENILPMMREAAIGFLEKYRGTV